MDATAPLAHHAPMIETRDDIIDLIGNAAFSEARDLVMAKDDFAPAFWDLRSGLLGELAQKLVNYGLTLRLTGDFAHETAASNAFRDFVRESRRTGPIFFVDSPT
ncbi:DUF4180 domain-containing protein [uncultured Maritimibacter sp.]|jgi:hypothetical protein|uniref:DUF4180 domain-containing protein n=1 Tax=uncultured Maritimibacter sp. TaxID=991866 RepID=UPI002613AF2A|nr:DUF4180 domain-containing protein [uncultured Maritimibacter sp.]